MSKLRLLREKSGLTQQKVAEILGKSQSEIARLERGERRLTVDWAVRLAPLYGVEPSQLIIDNTIVVTDIPPQVKEQIPILSGARGGERQSMYLLDGPLGWAARPANLAAVRRAYAVYVVGDSMSPRYEPGWLLHVNPIKPPTPGRDVVVRLIDDTVMIKSFCGWNDEALLLRQLNPAAAITVLRDQIIDVHLVVGCDQEG